MSSNAMRRGLRLTGFCASLAFPAVLLAQTAHTPVNAVAAQVVPPANWQHAGSDIPADPAWRTGILPNGLRYAVRRNARPAGNLSIRIRMDVGALMEEDGQQGWAHLFEHMAFRGSRDFPDGEGVKIWQRLGASFGSDSNAFTSLSATTYKLDLPRSDAASFDQAMRVLAGMMQNPTIDPKLLATERQVVIAEGAGRLPPLNRRIQQASRNLFLDGLKASRRDILGTPQTLAAATGDSLRAFQQHWYRPDRAVIVVVGDADPAMLEAGIRARFGEWKPIGPRPAEPDYGHAVQPALPAAVVADPQLPTRMTVDWRLQHDEAPMTTARVQQQFLRGIAVALLSRRLSKEVDRGQAILSAGAGFNETRHMLDESTMAVVPRGNEWKGALDQAFAVVNGMLSAPPSQGEVDQQLAVVREGLARSVNDRETALSGGLADAFIGDVDEGDVTASRQYYLDLFDKMRPTITPARIQQVLRDLLASDPRILLLSPTPVAPADVAAALTNARKVAGGTLAEVRAVSIDEIKLPQTPGKIVSDQHIDDLGIERIRFANGVELALKQTGFDKDRIFVTAELGHGALANDPGTIAPFWSSSAVAMGGAGPFNRQELIKLSSGRQIGFSIGAATDGIGLVSLTNRKDMADALKLGAVALTQPRFSPAALQQAKDEFSASYRSIYAQPLSVYRAFAVTALYGGDTRFRGSPSPDEVSAFTPDQFRAFWQQQLAKGPLRLVAVGDFDRDALVDAVARTYGALPGRMDTPPTAAQLDVHPPKPGGSLLLTHKGDPDQAEVIRAFPTPGVYEDLPSVRAITITQSIIESQLIDEFRESEGGTYSPMLSLNEPDYLPHYGTLLIGAQMKTARIADFEKALDRVLTSLATNGPSADALERAKATVLASIDRARAGNSYWLSIMNRDLDDPRVLDAVRSLAMGYRAVDAAAVKAAAARFLKPGPEGSFEVKVLPEKK